MPAAARGLALLIEGTRRERAGQWAEAARAFAQAGRVGVREADYWKARYQHLRALDESARWAEAARFAADLAPSEAAVGPAYAWRVARALRKTGRTDQFLALALQTFRDRPYRADPFTRALYVDTLGVLTGYPFEPRIVELLEDMGPRAQLYERVAEYAAVALDRGRAANAQAAARWLLAEHTNARFYPRYWAMLALGAFLEDDPEAFERYLDEVVARPPQLVEALPVSRQGAFFAEADAQLAGVLRQMLPAMAEWGDGAQARELRQRWLELVVRRAQRFIRQRPGSLARPQLVELYRIASSMLEEGAARAYPERVGRSESAPLVLGTVRVPVGIWRRMSPSWSTSGCGGPR